MRRSCDWFRGITGMKSHIRAHWLTAIRGGPGAGMSTGTTSVHRPNVSIRGTPPVPATCGPISTLFMLMWLRLSATIGSFSGLRPTRRTSKASKSMLTIPGGKKLANGGHGFSSPEEARCVCVLSTSWERRANLRHLLLTVPMRRLEIIWKRNEGQFHIVIINKVLYTNGNGDNSKRYKFMNYSDYI